MATIAMASSPGEARMVMPPDDNAAESDIPSSPGFIGRQLADSDSSENEDEELDAQAIYLQMRQNLAKGTDSVDPPKPALQPDQPLGEAAAVELGSPQAVRYSHWLSPKSRHSPTASVTSSPVKHRRSRPMANPFINEDDDEHDSDDSDLSANLLASDRFKTLVAKRRAERLADEEAEKAERDAERSEMTDTPNNANDADMADTADEERAADAALTHSSKPARKASKKALEAMNRETQRIQRNMQLAHQVKVKQKHTMSAFLQRFQQNRTANPAVEQSAAPLASSVATASDTDRQTTSGTPPSSPPSVDGTDKGKTPHVIDTTVNIEESSDDELVDPDVFMTQAPRPERTDKGKGPALSGPSILTKRGSSRSSPIRKQPRKIDRASLRPATDDEDDAENDLEVVKNRFPVFDKVKPLKDIQSRGLLIVRHLANLGHDPHPRGKSTMTPGQMNHDLLRRARQQAKEERDEKIAALKAKGLVILSAEEREKDQEELENMLDKARQDADELRKREKQAAKTAGRNEAGLEASDDESEDEDYVDGSDAEHNNNAADMDDDEESELELSGSDDEVEDESDAGSEDGSVAVAPKEHSQNSVSATHNEPDDPASTTRSRIKRRVILDDDDEEEGPSNEQPKAPTHGNTFTDETEDIAAAFGFAAAPVAAVGLADMFASTMEPSQTQFDSQLYREVDVQQPVEDSMDVFHSLVPPIATNSRVAGELDTIMADSIPESLQAAQTPISFRTMSMSQIPTPSQDRGFEMQSPVRDAPQSTVDTVLLPGVESSAVPRKKGRLSKRAVAEDDDEVDIVPSSVPATDNAFDAMLRRAASKREGPHFDKKRSDAKNMVDEDAEESEDEYAGLGGVSDDESVGEADEADKLLIDDATDEKYDSNQVRAYFAEKARADNEKQTSKLYKDIMSGALRRQRDGAFDLDSDDDDDHLIQQRRRKQREEARKRRLLLGDENLSKFDGDAKKEAFLRTMEDRDEDDEEMDLLDGKDMNEEETAGAESQLSQSASQPLDAVSGNSQKRKANDDGRDNDSQRPAKRAASSRAYEEALRKPTSISEVRQSVSFLIDEPHEQGGPGFVALSDDEDESPEVNEASSRAPYSARRTPAHGGVVDRLVLKKTASSNASNAATSMDTSSGTLAFAPALNRGFTNTSVPALLRRATTNNSSMGPPPVPGLKRDSSSMSSKLGADEGVVKRGGSKKSSINWAAREAERRALVDVADKARVDKVRKLASSLRAGRQSHLGALGGGFKGGFEA